MAPLLNILETQPCLRTDIPEGREYKDEGVNAICYITTFRLLGQFYLLYSNSLPTSHVKVKHAF